MTEKSLFISSCTRRQLARRRTARGLVRWSETLPPALLVALAGAAAFIVGRGGI